MKQWEMIDAFILDRCAGVGSKFTREDVQAYFAEQGWLADAGEALQSHRQHPPLTERQREARRLEARRRRGAYRPVGERVFTTQRVGMGPASHYIVAEDATRRQVSGSVRKLHRQQAEEMVKRWLNEHIYRMYPLAAHNPAAKRAMTSAATQIKLVAEVLGTRLDDIFGDENPGDED